MCFAYVHLARLPPIGQVITICEQAMPQTITLPVRLILPVTSSAMAVVPPNEAPDGAYAGYINS